MLEASYRGGVATRTGTPFTQTTPYGLQSSSDRNSVASMRERARKADRDNPIANGLLNRDTDNTIGDGMTLQMQTDSVEFNREAEELFYSRAEYLDIRQRFCFGDLQRQWYRCMRRDGDVAVLLVDRGGKSRLQTVTGEMITSPNGSTQTILDGMELDDVGRTVAYHILNQTELGKRTFSRVASNDCLYLSRDLFPQQVRGVSVFASIFPLLDQLDGYVDAVVIAARMAAVFGLIFKEANPSGAFQGLPTIANNGSTQRAITIQNGMVKYIGQADDVVQVQANQPMQQTPDFIRAIMRLIGLAFDMPLELALMDVSQANLSSLRGGLNQFYRSCRTRQDQFREKVMSPFLRWWISREVKAGSFKSAVPEDFWAHEWRPRAWQYADPITDVQSVLLEIDAGLKSPQTACDELNRDFTQIQNQIKEARDLRAGLGIPSSRSTYTRDEMGAPAEKPKDNNGTTNTDSEPAATDAD